MSHALIDGAARRQPRSSRRGLLESSFAHLFTQFVYPQIWEDPIVDMAALELNDDSRMISIASGGCNIMSYLTRRPCRVIAVDLNPAHLALLDLKLTAARHMTSHAQFFRFFGQANDARNVSLFDLELADRISSESRDFWSSRTLLGRRRIDMFKTGLYREGLLGRSLLAARLVCRLHGRDLDKLSNTRSHDELLAAYEAEVAPVFESRLMKTLFKLPAVLFGLGIPPRQFDVLTEDCPDEPHKVLAERTKQLLTAFPLDQNYFAHQALTQRYGRSLPPYLETENFATISKAAPAVDLRHDTITEVLDGEPANALDSFVLLDAQDWMNGEQLSDLWRAMGRTAVPGARMIYRTAGRQIPSFDEIPPSVRADWRRLDDRSAELHAQDRSGIYGGFHIYEKRP